MDFRVVLILVAVLSDSSVLAAFQLGYTAESCDDLRPTRVPFVQDMVGMGNPSYGSDGLPLPNQGGFNNRPNPSSQGFNTFNNQPNNMARPEGVNIQPILMTTVSPFRIWTSENRYKRGKVMEGAY